MMSKIEEFVEKNGIGESGKKEMIEILNESLLEISRVIMNEKRVKEKKVVELKKRYKSKKAEEYAEEHGISIEEFEEEEISKKDVENKVREIAQKNKNQEKSKILENKTVKKKEVEKERVICSGINKKGEACKSVGTIRPDGAKKKYCFRHAEDFISFECESDSSENEELNDIDENLLEEKSE